MLNVQGVFKGYKKMIHSADVKALQSKPTNKRNIYNYREIKKRYCSLCSLSSFSKLPEKWEEIKIKETNNNNSTKLKKMMCLKFVLIFKTCMNILVQNLGLDPNVSKQNTDF